MSEELNERERRVVECFTSEREANNSRPAPVQVPEGMAVIPTERYEQLLACEDAMVSLVKTGCIPAEIAGRTLLAADKEGE